jgi:hypothetical protein
MPAFKSAPKKVKSKNHEKMGKNENTQNSHSFLAIAFIRGICLSRYQRIWKQHKILRFFIPVLIFSTKKFFGSQITIALFAKLKANAKKLYNFKHFAKSKKYFFANIYHSPFDSH